MFIVKYLLSLYWVSCLFFVNTVSAANNNNGQTNQYVLQKIAQAPLAKSGKDKWLLLIEQPGNGQYYYLATQQGKVYQLGAGDSEHSSLLLDLNNLPRKKPIVALTSFTLHPNFSLRKQSGYHTFYTAHVEKRTTTNVKRISDPSIKTLMPYDAVITEWQLNSTKKVSLSTQREVVKIAIPTADVAIKQLSFNPYTQSWHDNFSRLYIALEQSPELQEYPLYSGAILRIKPEKLARLNYTIPDDNPFINNEKIDDAIYLLGAGIIKQFIWPDKDTNKLLVSHQYLNSKNSNDNSAETNKTLNSHWLSYSEGGDDWRSYSPKNMLYQSKNSLSAYSLFVYRGRNAPALRNKLLLLSKNKNLWQLNSVINDNNNNGRTIVDSQKTAATLQVEWTLPHTKLLTPLLNVFRDSHGELLFFNEDSGVIYQLFQQNTVPLHVSDNKVAQESNSSPVILLFIIIIALLGGYLFYRIKIQNVSAKSLVRRDFSDLSLTDDKLTLNLFRRHQKTIETTIEVVAIKQFELLIGDNIITTINTAIGHGFDDQQEQELHERFHFEQIAKMVDGKIRRISLAITSNDNEKYTICLYLRKGNDRITKNSYFEAVNIVIDWCWFFAHAINSENTGKRIFKAKIPTADIAQAEHKNHDDTLLHAQAASIRPDIITKATDAKAKQHNSDNHGLPANDNSSAEHSDKVEIELVNALEKLVKLHQQGFLTAEEFSQAKAKLINS